MTDREQDRLVPLRALDGYALARSEVDIRGWAIVDSAGATLGTVEELLVNPERAEVAALLVAPSSAVLPMDRAHVDERRRVVHSDVAAAELATPTAATSGSAAAHPGVTVERAANGDEVIRVPIVREELVVERRPVVKEVVVIRKRAVTDERVVEADLRRERVEIDRRGDVDVPRDGR